jgi:hypothetical protein
MTKGSLYLTSVDYLTSCKAFSESILVSDRTDSAASFEGIERWIEQCKTHPLCVLLEPSFLPRRVIDIGPSNDPVSSTTQFSPSSHLGYVANDAYRSISRTYLSQMEL